MAVGKKDLQNSWQNLMTFNMFNDTFSCIQYLLFSIQTDWSQKANVTKHYYEKSASLISIWWISWIKPHHIVCEFATQFLHLSKLVNEDINSGIMSQGQWVHILVLKNREKNNAPRAYFYYVVFHKNNSTNAFISCIIVKN